MTETKTQTQSAVVTFRAGNYDADSRLGRHGGFNFRIAFPDRYHAGGGFTPEPYDYLVQFDAEASGVHVYPYDHPAGVGRFFVQVSYLPRRLETKQTLRIYADGELHTETLCEAQSGLLLQIAAETLAFEVDA